MWKRVLLIKSASAGLAVAQNLLEAGASIFEVKEMLGHESLNTTEKYLRIHTSLMREVLFDE